jgi:dihydrofolate reductase
MAGDQGQGRGVRESPSSGDQSSSGRTGVLAHTGWRHLLPEGEGRVVLVAAIARNGIIGASGGLPWRLSSDLKRFKALTWGKPLVIGRKTFESIGRALPGRETIVVTRDRAFAPSGVLVAHNLDAALDLAAERAHAVGADDIIIGGGAEIYRQTIARAHRLFITEVALDAEGEARFPPIDPQEWREISREAGERGSRDEADFAFVSYERRT